MPKVVPPSVFLAGKFLFVRSDTFAARRIVETQNAQKESKKMRHEFLVFKTYNQACTFVYSALLTVDNLRRSASRTLFVHHT